ncbi:septal ring lytic transglycosylase RlpA family protein [Magnetospirillum aberrantis]
MERVRVQIFRFFMAVAGLALLSGEIQAGEVARATWYGGAYAGRPTASGEKFDPWAMTAAHPTLPLGTLVEVRRLTKNSRNGEYHSVVVRINDRMPGKAGRIDLSEGAARALRFRDLGGGPVEITPLKLFADAR